MKKVIDITGRKYARLFVLKQEYKNNRKVYWRCKCDCGKEVIIAGERVKSGHTKSCGCLKLDFQANGGARKTHGSSKTRLYAIWGGMIQRCYNPNKKKHKKDYQDRGITVCPEWHNFEAFMDWALANGYSENLSIERIDNNKGYSPDNCKWADNKTQANNRRMCVNITFNGITQTIAQWAEEIGMKYHVLYQRLLKGWDIESALLTPVGSRRLA